jgi:L-cysteine desulfidase
VVAATGSSCGITYLMGGTREQIGYAIKNMIGNITGMICDGAKPSCTLKVSNGVSTAMLSAMMAMENKVVTAVEGIAEEEVDKTIANLTKIGRFGMLETDRMILEIMTSK